MGPEVRTGVADVNGTRTYYELAGSGDPVVLVHAGIADSRMWDEQFPVFAREYTVVRYDLRGYGRTPAVAGPFSYHEDLAALLEYLGIRHTALVGCSMGGRTIIDFALAYPASVAALVSVAAGVSGYEGGERDDPPQWKGVVEAYEHGDLERASELEVQIWVDGPRRGPDQVPASVRDKVREMNLIPLAVPDELVDERRLEPPAYGRLREIAAPTLVVIGELDQQSEIEQSAYIAAHIPGAQQATLPTAHLPNMERPGEFNELVLRFLRSLSRTD